MASGHAASRVLVAACRVSEHRMLAQQVLNACQVDRVESDHRSPWEPMPPYCSRVFRDCRLSETRAFASGEAVSETDPKCSQDLDTQKTDQMFATCNRQKEPNPYPGLRPVLKAKSEFPAHRFALPTAPRSALQVTVGHGPSVLAQAMNMSMDHVPHLSTFSA